MCSDWQGPPMYPVPTDAHIQPFMPAMTYSHPGYNLGGEIHDINCNRENNRRNNRGRGIRRDNFNRGMNPANEMQQGYMGEQGQFHPQLSFVVMYPDRSDAATTVLWPCPLSSISYISTKSSHSY